MKLEWRKPGLMGDRSRLKAGGAPWPRRNVSYGRIRGLFKPKISAETLQRLGPVRHALAQRAICGLLEVHAPFATMVSESPKR